MKKIFEKIWNLALPHQDKIDDKGHARTVTSCAYRLLEKERADENIVIPAAILHDVGWSQLPRKERFLKFSPTATKEEKIQNRLKHQKEGVKIARRILEKVDYPPNLSEKILEIISQHDTRKGFISKEEGLVRDADKLWRFSKIGFKKDLKRFNFTFQQLEEKLLKNLKDPNFIYSQTAKNIAEEELKNRKKELWSD